MKRLVLRSLGSTLLLAASGCCCNGMRSGCTPCAAPATYGAIAPGAALPIVNSQAAFVTPGQPVTAAAISAPYGGPATTTAMLPLESLPTY